MHIDTLTSFLDRHQLPKFRLAQIQRAIFQDGVASFDDITTLSKDLRQTMVQELRLLSFDVKQVLVSRAGDSIKALLALADGNLIETVLIAPKPGMWTACISCQVGCQMGCRFCATGAMGFVRNLNAEEITDQVLFWKQYLKKNLQLFENSKLDIKNSNVSVGNIVYMGMGEPFNNWQHVAESVRLFTNETLFGFGSRSISISTSGIASGITRMANEFPQVNLAISLHFATDEKRDRFMPVNVMDNLDRLRQALREYFSITKRKVFLEYIMLDGINDSALDARMLADYIFSIGSPYLLHVNLIRYNATTESLQPSGKNKTHLFKAELAKHGVAATIRKSLGDEIKGACGQLAAH